MKETRPIIVATHRRAGTHWTIDALRMNSPDIHDKFLMLEQIEPSHDFPIHLSQFQQELYSAKKFVLIKTHALPTASTWTDPQAYAYAKCLLDESQAIYVYRDGRDVLVSLYYYMQKFRPELLTTAFSDFIRMNNSSDNVTTMNRPAFWQHHVRSWLERENLFALSYESLERDYENTLRRMADFLGIRLKRNLISVTFMKPKTKPLYRRMLRRIAPSISKKTSSAVIPRKGQSGDWHNHFNDDDLDFFMQHASDAMKMLAYID